MRERSYLWVWYETGRKRFWKSILFKDMFVHIWECKLLTRYNRYESTYVCIRDQLSNVAYPQLFRRQAGYFRYVQWSPIFCKHQRWRRQSAVCFFPWRVCCTNTVFIAWKKWNTPIDERGIETIVLIIILK